MRGYEVFNSNLTPILIKSLQKSMLPSDNKGWDFYPKSVKDEKERNAWKLQAGDVPIYSLYCCCF
jgi:hypothetical protein